MGSASHAAILRPAHVVIGRNGLLDRYFYFAMSLLAATIVIWGFSHSVNDNLFHPTVPRPLILWFHAAVFSAWVVFYILQSALVRTHHVGWHRSAGWFGAGLGTVMVPLGVATAIAMSRFRTFQLHERDAALFQIVPFYDMLAFAILLALGILWRKKPQLHRRILFIATCGLLDAAFGRWDYLFDHHLYFVGVDLVILLGVGRDFLVDRRVHAVYRVALPLLVVAQAFVIYTLQTGSSWWARTAHSLMG